jgi:Zn-dependent protease with chaperone function
LNSGPPQTPLRDEPPRRCVEWTLHTIESGAPRQTAIWDRATRGGTYSESKVATVHFSNHETSCTAIWHRVKFRCNGSSFDGPPSRATIAGTRQSARADYPGGVVCVPIQFNCPLCDASFRVKEEFGGKQASCKKCGGSLIIPQAEVQLEMVTGNDAKLQLTKSSRAAVASRQQEILNAFQGNIEPVRVSVAYRLSALLVMCVMLVLPVIYLCFIVLIGVGVLYHFANHTWMLTATRGRAAIFMAIAYAAPALIGAIAVVFMIKPLFARRSHLQSSRALTQSGEPLLFAFVARVAEAIGAPCPKRIEVDSAVNASAGFRRGWLSFLIGNDLTLTLGAPLIAGLSMQQLAGVIGHEFGHFSQGAGMRLSYVILSISHWFTRVVYERDEWDDWLENVAGEIDFRIGWIFLLAQGFVWLGRGLLWILMMIGHAVSGVLLRQMEFDADRNEARLVGSDMFESTSRRIMELSAANEKSMGDLVGLINLGVLGDNLPKLVMHNVARIPRKTKSTLRKAMESESTGLFDTHPSFASRVKNAQQENTPGVFRIDAAASDLFLHFDPLCRNVTWDLYRDLFGVHINPAEMKSMAEILNTGQISN